MSIYVERLRRPEEEDGEEIGAGYEGDDQGQGENSRALFQACWKDGKFGEFRLPDSKRHE